MQNLSQLADKSIVGMSSMAMGNTISVPPPDGAPGSESEATQGIETHSTPNMDLGAQSDLKDPRKVSAGARPATSYEWNTVK